MLIKSTLNQGAEAATSWQEFVIEMDREMHRKKYGGTWSYTFCFVLVLVWDAGEVLSY